MTATPDHPRPNQTDPEAQTRKVADLIRGNRLAMLTTTAPDGTLTSRPMALQEVEFDGDLWFFTDHASRKVAHVAGDPQVNVTVTSSSTWVSLTGQALEVDDQGKKRELWSVAVGAWFPGGPDDPDVRLLKVNATSAEYWDSPSGRLATLLSFARAKITGQRFDGGDNETVTMI